MNRLAVQSKEIAIVGYDSKKSKLEVVFRRGGVYRYSGVPQDVYQDFMNADSHGSYFESHIKERYPYVKLS